MCNIEALAVCNRKIRLMPVLSRTQKSWLHFLKDRFRICQKDKQSRCKYFLEHIFLGSTDSFFSRRHVPQLSIRQYICKYFLEDRFINCQKHKADESTYQKTDSSTIKTTEQMQVRTFQKTQINFFQKTPSSTVKKTKQMQVLSRRHRVILNY